MVLVEVAGKEYYINAKLKRKWDKIKDGNLTRIDTDRVYITDGRERSGKSLFTIQQAAYIDPSIVEDPKLSRICFTPDEFLLAIKNTDSDDETTKCIIYDEAFRGLASRAAMSRINRKIIAALMEVGQKNLVIWIVLPSFFMLDLYAAMLRSNALFHVKKDLNSNLRSFYVYSYKKKGKLYQNGIRKGWTYAVKTKFKDHFYEKYPGGDEFEKRYRAKKAKALHDSEKELHEEEKEGKYLVQRNLLVYYIINKYKTKHKDLVAELKKVYFDTDSSNIPKMLLSARNFIEKRAVIDGELAKKAQKADENGENT